MDASENLAITSELVGRALLEGALLALILIALTHLFRRHAGPILFVALLIASLAYVRFAFLGDAGTRWLLTEILGVVVFGAIGWLGLRRSLWWLATAWALHPLWDIALHYIGPGSSFVHPLRYPIPCVSFDLLVAAYLAYLAPRKSKPAPALATGVKMT